MAMWFRIAGSASEYRAMSNEERRKVRETAAYLKSLGSDYSTAKAAESTELRGHVYVIDHPRLPGVKVGRAYDPESRLRGYQTGCPERAYRLRYAVYFEDCMTAERTIHERLRAHQMEGEWFAIQPDEAAETIDWCRRETDDE